VGVFLGLAGVVGWGTTPIEVCETQIGGFIDQPRFR
jgi:hypothetical protein